MLVVLIIPLEVMVALHLSVRFVLQQVEEVGRKQQRNLTHLITLELVLVVI